MSYFKVILVGVVCLGLSTAAWAYPSGKNLIKVGIGLTEGLTYGYEHLLGENHGVHVSYGTVSGVKRNAGTVGNFSALKQELEFYGAGVGYRYYFSGKDSFKGPYAGLGFLFKTIKITERQNSFFDFAQTNGVKGTAKGEATIPYVELGTRGRINSLLAGVYIGYGSADFDFDFTGTLDDDRLKFAKTTSWFLLGVDFGFVF